MQERRARQAARGCAWLGRPEGFPERVEGPAGVQLEGLRALAPWMGPVAEEQDSAHWVE